MTDTRCPAFGCECEYVSQVEAQAADIETQRALAANTDREAMLYEAMLEGAAIARNEILRRLIAVQYDPAPYTACKTAILKLNLQDMLAKHQPSHRSR